MTLSNVHPGPLTWVITCSCCTLKLLRCPPRVSFPLVMWSTALIQTMVACVSCVLASVKFTYDNLLFIISAKLVCRCGYVWGKRCFWKNFRSVLQKPGQGWSGDRWKWQPGETNDRHFCTESLICTFELSLAHRSSQVVDCYELLS